MGTLAHGGPRLRTRLALALALAALASAPTRARAFLGFYASGSDRAVGHHATTVIVMREGTSTVLTVQSDYVGPREDFVWIVPVPETLALSDVATLDPALVERVERLTGPRLSDEVPMHPCNEGTIPLEVFGGPGQRTSERVEAVAPAHDPDAPASSGVFDLELLGAEDSRALESWLRAHALPVPSGAGDALRPYLETGTRFLVARVHADRLRFEADRAVLPPLRLHYQSATLSLPLQLGLLSAAGPGDLVVVVLARQRFEAANYANVFVPTNVDATGTTHEGFGAFYDALLTRTFAEHPRSVVTEYSWPATTCEPCPEGAMLDEEALDALGATVLYGGVEPPRLLDTAGRELHLLTERPEASGPRSMEVIRRVFRRHVPELRHCYARDPATRVASTTAVDLRWVIDTAGVVREASAVAREDGTLAESVLRCLADGMRGWTFPAAPEGAAGEEGESRVSIGLVFSAEPPPPVPEWLGTRSNPVRTPGISGVAPPRADELVATRLHYRFDREGLPHDLELRGASSISGGREDERATTTLDDAVRPSETNAFQARYATRPPFEGGAACPEPLPARWARALTPPTIAPAHTTPVPVVAPASSTHAAPPPAAVPPAAEESSGLCSASAARSCDVRGLAVCVLAALALVVRRRRA